MQTVLAWTSNALKFAIGCLGVALFLFGLLGILAGDSVIGMLQAIGAGIMGCLMVGMVSILERLDQLLNQRR